MKKYIKDGKIYNAPIMILHNKLKIYTNDQQVLLTYGFMPYEEQIQPKKSLQQLIQESDKEINAETDEIILNNFVYDGNQFYLTTENQINFSNMFVAKDYLDYPQTVKTKTGFIELQNSDAVISFYLSGIAFIKASLEEGWRKKAEAAEEIRNNYSN